LDAVPPQALLFDSQNEQPGADCGPLKHLHVDLSIEATAFAISAMALADNDAADLAF